MRSQLSDTVDVRQMRSGRSRRRLRLTAGVAVVVALVTGTGWLLIKDARGAEIATVLGLPVAVLSLLAAVVAVTVAARSVDPHQAVLIDPPVATERSVSLIALVDDFAAEVAIQWRGEQISDPLPVRWTRTARTVADHRERIIPDDASADQWELAGQLDDVAAFFSTLPSRRLVVLGDSGTGKTALAIHLLLSLLHRRRSGEPVPVLLPISSWDPATLSVADWLAATLTMTYPALGVPVTEELTRAAALLRDGLLIPILDGFDEMPEQLRPRALRRLNWLRSPTPKESRTLSGCWTSSTDATWRTTSSSSSSLRSTTLTGQRIAGQPRPRPAAPCSRCRTQ